MKYRIMKVDTKGISERVKAFMLSKGLGFTDARIALGVAQTTLRKAIDGKPMTEQCAERISKALDSLLAEKPEPPKEPVTFKRYPGGMVFVRGKDERMMSEAEKERVKSANLKEGRQYYANGRFFTPMGFTHVYKE